MTNSQDMIERRSAGRRAHQFSAEHPELTATRCESTAFREPSQDWRGGSPAADGRRPPTPPSGFLPFPSLERWRAAACVLSASLFLLAGGEAAQAQEPGESTLPTVSVSDAEAYEDDGRMSFEVSLSQPSSEQVTVQLSTSSGTATSGTDFQAASWTATFGPNWTGPYRVSLAVHDDQEIESDETFTVTLTNPVGATLGDATATGTIRNDDTAATLTASEIEDTTATLTIGGHTDGWWYKGAGSWYQETGSGKSVHPCTAVAAGTSAVSIGGLTAAAGYRFWAYSDSSCSTRLAKVRFSTLASEGTPTVSVSDAQQLEGSSTSEGGIDGNTWMVFQVSLSQPSRERVTVELSTSDGTATSGTDYYSAVSRTLTFPANRREPQIFSVLVREDLEPEPDETFTLTLTNPVGATLGDATATGTIKDDGDTTFTASDITVTTATLTIGDDTGDWSFKGKALPSGPALPCTAVAAGTAAVSISGLTAAKEYEFGAYSGSTCRKKVAKVEFRTLAPSGTPTVSVSDAQMSEGGAWMTFWVSLSAPSREQVTVDVHTSDGTAASGTDFRAVSRTLTFPANSGDPLPVRVLVYDDQESGPDETFTLTLTNPTGATLGDATATGTIKDDDTAQDTTPPRLVSAKGTSMHFGKVGDGGSFGWRLNLTYNEPLDNASLPAKSDFVLKVDGSPVAVGGVSIERRFGYVLLDMPSQKLWGDQVVTLSYTPGTNPIQDTTGNDAPTLVDLAVIVDKALPQRPPSEQPPTGRRPVADAGGVEQVAGSAGVQVVGTGAAVTLDGSGSSDPDGDSLTFAWAQRPLHGEITGPGGRVLDKGGKVFLTDAHTSQATFVAPMQPGVLYFELTVSDPSGRADGDAVLVEVRDLEASDAPGFGANLVAAMTLTSGEAMEPVVLPEATGGNGELTYALTSRSRPANLALTPVVSTSPPPGLSFDPVTRTLLGTPTTNGTWSVSYTAVDADDDTRDSDKALQIFTIDVQDDPLAPPAATGVAVVSDPGADATYAAGDAVRVAVTFSEAVDVDTENGTPRLKLDLGGDDGAGERWAAYEDGSSTETLTFAWTVAAPDESAVGVAVLADTLETGGGTIRSAATQADVALGHPGRDHDPAHKVDAVAPSAASASVSGSALTVTFDEDLAAAASLENGAFAVKRTPSGGTEAAVDLSTTVAPAISGRTVTLTLASAVVSGDTAVKVSYAKPASGSGNALVDAAGNEVADFADRAVSNVTGPTVTEVTVVSDPGADATYAAGDAVRVAVRFSEAVEVDTEDGTPRLKLDLGGDDGAGERWAAYEGGSGTETLTFAWAAAAPDESTEGVAVLADTLELNGGTIASVATKIGAALGHPGLDPDPEHKVDTTPPRLLRGEIDGGTMRLHFSEVLDPDSTGGDFLMAVETPERGVVGFDAAGGVRVEGAVVTVGLALDKGYPGATEGLDRNSMQYWRRADGSDGALRDPAGNLVAAPGKSRTTDGVAMRFFRTDLENVTGPAASVTGVEVISDAGADRTYGHGDRIEVRVTFGEPVDVTGTPRLKIDMDPAHWGEKWASYESGGGTSSLTFVHAVVEPNLSRQGIAVLANTLETGGGTIRAGGADVNLAHDGLAHDASHKVDWRIEPESGGAEDPSGLVGDDGPPTVTGVRVVSSPASGSTYLLGESIRIRATFSEPVTVTGIPRLSIDMDTAHWGTKRAAYASGGGTSSLDFVHTVVEPNYSTQGIAVLANSLTANGGAIRSADGTDAALGHTGRGHDSGHKVDWRPTISVADARADEGAGATVAFEVSLSRAFTTAAHSVTVDYATADGTAKAGEDYTATSGTLTFAAGERTKTVNVPVLDDAHDEGEETFVLRLSNLSGARAGDLEATGTIVNSDPVPQAWLARFGRAVADQSVDAVRSRLSADRTPGFRGRIAGEALPDGSGTANDAGTEMAGATDDPFAIPELTERERLAFLALLAPEHAEGDAEDLPESGAMAAKDAMSDTAFEIARKTDGGLSLGLWGRIARSGFSGRQANLTLDGDVTSAMLGADWERRDTLFGLMLFRSRGEGGYAGPVDAGRIEADLSGLVPWAGRRTEGSPTFWGAAGTGRGEMTLTPEGRDDDPFVAGLRWSMAAAGAEGAPGEIAALGGANVRWRADALLARTESDAVDGLAATSAETARLRLGLEAAWTRTLDSGATLSSRADVGLRHDGGDAEAGLGLEAGGGVRFENPGTGLSVSLDGRTLALHEDGNFEDWGVSVSLEWDPRPETRLGPSVIAARGWGGASSGGMAALLDPEALPGPAEAGEGTWSLEAAYGVRRVRGMTGSAYGRADGADGLDGLRVGWRVEPEAAGHAADLSADLWAAPETAGDGSSAVGAGLEWRW